MVKIMVHCSAKSSYKKLRKYPDGKYAVSVHYQITINAMLKAGFSRGDARRIAHRASMYADHPDKKALTLNNLGKSGSLGYRNDID